MIRSIRTLARTSFVALVLAGVGIASAQALNLEFDKAAVGDTVWTGRVSGDVEGTLTTVLIAADTSQAVWQVEFYWIVTADDPAMSFVVRLTGTLNSETGEVQMSGSVVDGYREGAAVDERGQLYDADTSAFRGTIEVHAD
jgi:hypothetical protein